jgi:hypothetical protein
MPGAPFLASFARSGDFDFQFPANTTTPVNNHRGRAALKRRVSSKRVGVLAPVFDYLASKRRTQARRKPYSRPTTVCNPQIMRKKPRLSLEEQGTKRVNRGNQTSKHQPTKGKIRNIVPLRLHVEPEKNQRLAQSANAFHLLTTETTTLESVADGLIPPEAAKPAILLSNEPQEPRSVPHGIHLGSE